jgi:hypothetical protein
MDLRATAVLVAQMVQLLLLVDKLLVVHMEAAAVLKKMTSLLQELEAVVVQ